MDDFTKQCQDTEEEMQDNVNHFSSFRQIKNSKTKIEMKETVDEVSVEQLPGDDLDNKKKSSWWTWWNPYSYFY